MIPAYTNLSPSSEPGFDEMILFPSPSAIHYKLMYINEQHIQASTSSNELKDHPMVFNSFYEAAYYLQHLPGNSDLFPDAIISYYDQEALKDASQFGSFLAREEKLSTIPFILIDQKQSGKTKPASILGIDDIVRGNISTEELYSKIELLKKFKSLKQSNLRLIYPGKTNASSGKRPMLQRIDRMFKRALDIIVSATALIILSPLMLLIILIIKLESKGPVFYTAYRAGSNYLIFKFIKFRSMVVDADKKLAALKDLNQYGASDKSNPVFFKISNDPRITRFGKFLRNTSLDELPQLFNVLKGEMSLVGNRPLPLYEAKTLTTDLYAERFNAPAGITGLWQVSKRGRKEMSVEERIALDIDYARKHSFWYDLKIILITPKALAQKDNV